MLCVSSVLEGTSPFERAQTAVVLAQVRDQDQQAARDRRPCSSSIMTFREVKELADSQRGLELPGFTPYSAVQALISRNSRGWAGACAPSFHPLHLFPFIRQNLPGAQFVGTVICAFVLAAPRHCPTSSLQGALHHYLQAAPPLFFDALVGVSKAGLQE